MQVGGGSFASSLPHSHYHAYYHLHPPGPQDHQLKRTYLALLPPPQIIELCLALDSYVPPYARPSIWPPDMTAAIAALQKAPPPPTNSAPEDPRPPPKDDPPPAVMASLKSPEVEKEASPGTENLTVAEPRPPDKEVPSTVSDGAPAGSENIASAPPPAADPTPASSDQPKPSATSEPPPAQPIQSAPGAASAVPPPHPSYPYPYGHSQTAAYPHTPYYSGGYPYPYSYPAQYPHLQPPPPPPPSTYPIQPQPHHQPYAPLPPVPHPHQPLPEGAADDLPSYEEMIVEALTECTDTEGWAPKDLFTWMASRYPIQSNFRPSASQALQKAFRRGRFEKSSNGKYRLNSNWEGGSTSRRTTRRPQIHHTVPGPPQQNQSSTTTTPIPPFTNIPRVHSSSPATHPQQPYGYQQYPPQHNYGSQPPASTAPTPFVGGKTVPSGADATPANISDDPTVASAYEAAQNILKAINFGGLLQLPPEERQEPTKVEEHPQPSEQGSSANGTGVEVLLSHVQAMLASNASGSAAGGSAIPDQARMILPAPTTSGSNPSDPRAELQAHLALLAAQLTEYAQEEEASHSPPAPPVSTAPPVEAPPPIRPQEEPPTPAPPMTLLHALSASAPVMAALEPEPSVPPAVLPEPDRQEMEESEEDDDMEEVI